MGYGYGIINEIGDSVLKKGNKTLINFLGVIHESKNYYNRLCLNLYSI